MDLQKNSVEYAHIVFSVTPPTNSSVSASVDLMNWTNVTIDGTGVGKVLLCGPNSGSTAGIVVSKTTYLWVRVNEAPEIVIRSAGQIRVY